MTKYDDASTLVDEANTVTNALGAVVQTLIDDINHTATDGMSGAQTENVIARLTPLAANLKALFANASNPIVAPPPPPPPMPGPFGPN